mmetsp:Transcript_1459/g.3158  ORF Transcript_1459/g.3158 Transcript_1459/m.3158 type:complete len:89 (-) Transcript_1459:487-753(-)
MVGDDVVGPFDGESVGDLLGPAEGEVVGDSVGDAVGPPEGSAVGPSEGSAVGSKVPSHDPTIFHASLHLPEAEPGSYPQLEHDQSVHS